MAGGRRNMQLGIRHFAVTYTLRAYVGNINRNYASSGSSASVKFNVHTLRNAAAASKIFQEFFRESEREFYSLP